jgi:hypothetical protein
MIEKYDQTFADGVYSEPPKKSTTCLTLRGAFASSPLKV